MLTNSGYLYGKSLKLLNTRRNALLFSSFYLINDLEQRKNIEFGTCTILGYWAKQEDQLQSLALVFPMQLYQKIQIFMFSSHFFPLRVIRLFSLIFNRPWKQSTATHSLFWIQEKNNLFSSQRNNIF